MKATAGPTSDGTTTGVPTTVTSCPPIDVRLSISHTTGADADRYAMATSSAAPTSAPATRIRLPRLAERPNQDTHVADVGFHGNAHQRGLESGNGAPGRFGNLRPQHWRPDRCHSYYEGGDWPAVKSDIGIDCDLLVLPEIRPTTPTVIRQRGNGRIHRFADPRLRTGEQLFDVPHILVSSGEQLQQDQVTLQHNGDFAAHNQRSPCSTDDILLPAVAANDDVNITFVSLPQADDPSKGIAPIAGSYINVDSLLDHRGPEGLLEQPGARREQVDVVRRTRNPCTASAPAPISAHGIDSRSSSASVAPNSVTEKECLRIRSAGGRPGADEIYRVGQPLA